MAKAINHIEYQISKEAIRSHNPSHLAHFFQTLSLAKGKALAALNGCFNIVLEDESSPQPYVNSDVRAYCQELVRTPLGLSYFLCKESESLQLLAFAIVDQIKTVEVKTKARTSNIGVRCESADLVAFLTPDLEVAEKLFTQAGLGTKKFDDCVQHISGKFKLKPGDWD
jgi:hypothetical protein